ncbi:YncE family protein [uncultured Microbacterium sp.]|uniref:YncE family protein n=1 Tax=uncultured Microbacterium sp. TaxID=191216 RepID=UPI0025D3D7EE|nr:YncE family protein [uncultured Microbacterium sp.]
MTATPTRAIARLTRRLALIATLALTVSVTPGVTPASAYMTAENLQPDNTFATADLTIDDLTATRDKTGITTISWKDATTQQWAKANGVSGIRYTATSKTAGGCNVTNTTETSITGQWPAGADCTITYTYAGWTATATVTVPFPTVDVGSKPLGIAIAPDGKSVYVANSASAYISTIATTKLDVGQISTPAATGLYGVAVTPDGSRLCFTSTSTTVNAGWGYKATIDLANSSYPETEVRSSMRPYGVAYSARYDACSVVAASTDGPGSFGALNPFISDQPRIQLENNPRGLTFSSDGSAGYVANWGSDSVSRLNLQKATVDRTIYKPGSRPTGVAIAKSFLYVTNSGDDTVSAIDSRTISQASPTVTTIDVGKKPGGIAVSAQGKSVYIANAGSNTVSVIDAASNTVVKTLPTGRTPSGIAVSPDGGTIYVTNRDDDTVSIIPTGRAETSTTG